LFPSEKLGWLDDSVRFAWFGRPIFGDVSSSIEGIKRYSFNKLPFLCWDEFVAPPPSLRRKKNRLRTMPGVSHAQGASIALGLGAHHSNAPEEGGQHPLFKEILVDNKN